MTVEDTINNPAYDWTRCLRNNELPTNGMLNEAIVEQIRQDYRAELPFNKYFLDDASENQSMRFDRWNSLAADARSLKEWLERQRKYKRRHHEHEIRRLGNSKDPADAVSLKLTYELEKVTEAGLALAARRQQEIIDLDWLIFWATRLVGVLEGGAESFRSRKEMVQVAQRLALGQYFGDVAEGRQRHFEQCVTTKIEVPDADGEPARLPRAPRRTLPRTGAEG